MEHQSSSGYVKTEQHKGIATIEFFHPQSNSLPGKILQDLSSAIKQAGDDLRYKSYYTSLCRRKSFLCRRFI